MGIDQDRLTRGITLTRILRGIDLSQSSTQTCGNSRHRDFFDGFVGHLLTSRRYNRYVCTRNPLAVSQKLFPPSSARCSIVSYGLVAASWTSHPFQQVGSRPRSAGDSNMSRTVCLAIILGSLVATPGCSSCFGGGNSCRRPSFMEFRSPCSRGQETPPACGAPMAPACGAPACGAPACGPAPCCEQGGAIMQSPSSGTVVSESGTFS